VAVFVFNQRVDKSGCIPDQFFCKPDERYAQKESRDN
jgi:hypothetical protein